MKEPTVRYPLISNNFCKDTYYIINKANLFLVFFVFAVNYLFSLSI